MSLNITTEMLGVVSALKTAEIPHAVCGGIALAAHGCPRATIDIDLLLEERDVERAKSVVKPLGFEFDAGLITFDFGKPTERRLHRVSKVEGSEVITLDLIIVTPRLIDIWEARMSLPLGGKTLDVVSREGLIQMKQLAGRLQDLADIEALESVWKKS